VDNIVKTDYLNMDQFQGTSGGTKLRGNLLTQLHLKMGVKIEVVVVR